MHTRNTQKAHLAQDFRPVGWKYSLVRRSQPTLWPRRQVHRERYHLTLPRTTRRIPCKIKQTISPWTLCRPCLGGALLHLDKYSWTELFTQPTHACRGKTILFPRPELCLEQTSIFWALLVIDFTVFWSAHAAKTVSISTSLERPGIWRLSSPRTGGQPEGPPSWQARSAWAEARQ